MLQISCSVFVQQLTLVSMRNYAWTLYHVLWFALNRIHDRGDEDELVETRRKYDHDREDGEFWWNTREVGSLCGTCRTVFLCKQHRWGPPSASLEFDRRQNVRLVERSSDTRKTRYEELLGDRDNPSTTLKSLAIRNSRTFSFLLTKPAWRRNRVELRGRSEEASGPLQFWSKP